MVTKSFKVFMPFRNVSLWQKRRKQMNFSYYIFFLFFECHFFKHSLCANFTLTLLQNLSDNCQYMAQDPFFYVLWPICDQNKAKIKMWIHSSKGDAKCSDLERLRDYKIDSRMNSCVKQDIKVWFIWTFVKLLCEAFRRVLASLVTLKMFSF